jgi:hypothetical protein
MRRWRAEEREEAGYLQLRVGRAMGSRGLLSGYSGDRSCVPLLCRLRCVRRIRACSVSERCMVEAVGDAGASATVDAAFASH